MWKKNKKNTFSWWVWVLHPGQDLRGASTVAQTQNLTISTDFDGWSDISKWLVILLLQWAKTVGCLIENHKCLAHFPRGTERKMTSCNRPSLDAKANQKEEMASLARQEKNNLKNYTPPGLANGQTFSYYTSVISDRFAEEHLASHSCTLAHLEAAQCKHSYLPTEKHFALKHLNATHSLPNTDLSQD